jgi:tetratricopeptide (TPR) repeat protein
MGNKNKKTRNIIGIVLVVIIGLVVWSMISTQEKWKFEKLGLVEYEKGNYQGAVEYYDLGLQSDSGNASLYNNRGLVYFKLKEYKKALSDYNKAIILKPDFAVAYCNRGLAHFKSARAPGAADRDKAYNRAILDFTKAIEFDPKHVDAYYNRGLCYNKSFMGINYDAGKPFASEAEDAFQRALADFDKALELDPSYALAFAGKGSAYYRHGGEYNKAIAEFTKALKLKDEIAKRWGNEALAGVYANTGRNYTGLQGVNELEKAASCFDKAAELGKLGHGAWVYGLLRNYNKALEFRNKRIHLIENDPDSKDHKRIGSAYAARGKTYYLLGQYDKARADFNKALASGSPDRHGYSNAKVHRFLGKINLKTGKEQDAKKEFNKAITLYTDKTGSRIKSVAASAYSDRGRCYFNLGVYDKAISDLEKAIALNAPSYPKECPRVYPMALKNLGVVYWKMGNRDKANEYFKKSIKLFEEREEKYYAREIEDALKTGDVLKILVLHPGG